MIQMMVGMAIGDEDKDGDDGPSDFEGSVAVNLLGAASGLRSELDEDVGESDEDEEADDAGGDYDEDVDGVDALRGVGARLEGGLRRVAADARAARAARASNGRVSRRSLAAEEG